MSKVLFTIPVVGGGMGRAVMNYSSGFLNLGYKVGIFLLADSGINQYDLPANISVYSGVKGKYNKIKFFLSLWRLRKLCKNESFDFVFSFSGMHSCYVLIALMGLGTKVYVFHRANPYKTYGIINDWLNRLFFSRSEGLVVQTQIAKSFFRDKYGHPNIIHVPNPVKELLVYDNIPKDDIIITVSRLVNGKGIDKLINIFSELSTGTNNGWILQIVGDGELREQFQDLTRSLGMEHKVQFLGFQKEVDLLLAKASIFAFSSQSEGFPNALLEAMSVGLPCISFDCPTGPSELIQDNVNGFLIELGDDTSYKNKLATLMKDRLLRDKFSFEAKKIKHEFDLNVIISRFVSEITQNQK
ncbi:MAG: glycosyltransferase [Bacteroidales bacterium]